MAESPAHKFGQIIGDVLEQTVEPLLQRFAEEHRLYLDKQGPRPARTGKTLTWTDAHGNKHDLDYVLEKSGTLETIGTPAAFIETAWRRYTKHSRNKAQEIQGALLPLAEAYQASAPFIGCILAGVFTEGALAQLRSLGFVVLHFPYDTVLAAFRQVGIDASCDESTSDDEFHAKIEAWQSLPEARREMVASALIQANSTEVDQFIKALDQAVSRHIQVVRVTPLHGLAFDSQSVEDAIAFIQDYDENATFSRPIIKYEVEIRYNNGDRVQGQFTDKATALRFLSSFAQSHL